MRARDRVESIDIARVDRRQLSFDRHEQQYRNFKTRKAQNSCVPVVPANHSRLSQRSDDSTDRQSCKSNHNQKHTSSSLTIANNIHNSYRPYHQLMPPMTSQQPTRAVLPLAHALTARVLDTTTQPKSERKSSSERKVREKKRGHTKHLPCRTQARRCAPCGTRTACGSTQPPLSAHRRPGERDDDDDITWL